MKNKNNSKLAAIAAAFAIAGTTHAANIAYDNASAYAYDNGWQTGDNGGYGWGPWTLQANGLAGFFVSTSTANGNGIDDGIIGGLPFDDDIDTEVGPNPDNSAGGNPVPNSTQPRSLGMLAAVGGGSEARAYRSFTGGPLTVGQGFNTAFDTGNVAFGATVGIGLLNAGGETLWELFYMGGMGGLYSYQDGSGFDSTSVEFGTEGLELVFLLTGPDSYQMQLTRRDGMSDTVTGSLMGLPDQDITQIHVYNLGAGFDQSDHFYINNLELIPEPTSAALALSFIGLSLLRRRR